ncbi:plasmid replication protein RepB [Pseudomonas koreensis]|jgi:hypothetical protein
MQPRLVLLRYYHNDSRGVMAVDLSAMRKLFKDGGLKSAIVTPAPMQSGWELIVVHTDGTLDYMTVARSDRRKIYKSLESVHADAKRVGFVEVTTQVEAMQVA